MTCIEICIETCIEIRICAMSPMLIGCAGLGALFVLIFLQVPIAFAMMAVGVIGFGLQAGWQPAFSLLASDPSQQLSSLDLATVPLFLMMGTFASAAGFSEDVYGAAAALLGHRRGGLAYATIGGCAAFGAICGSSTATAATFGKVALPQMLRRGYSPGFSAGTIAAGGTLKALIPPSLVMILYCVVAKTYIFDLFAAAVVPALLTIALNMVAIAVKVRINPEVAPLGPRIPWPERVAACRKAAPAALLMTAIFGGLYSGAFTVNEAASVAAVLSLGLAIVRRRMSWRGFVSSLEQAAGASVMLYFILMGASVSTYFITLAHVPETLVNAVGLLSLPPLAIIFLLLLTYLILGSVFEEISAILITLPFVLPIVVNLGYDPVWWGVMNVIQVELALMHPPLGVIVFLLHGIAPDISMNTIYRGVVPFIIADLIVLLLLMLFPQIALWLPHFLAS